MALFIAVALLALFVIVLILRDWPRFKRLPALDSSAQPKTQPTVTIVIPARNEEINIGRCLHGALTQTYAKVDVVVVDDGSTDDTPRIIAGILQQHPTKLHAVPGRPLPKGWVGKCNACLHGASFATGDWILFLDADTFPQPALVQSLVAYAEQRDLQVATTFPLNELPTLPEQMVLPVFYQFALTAFPVQALTSPEPPASNTLANGQCLMVKRDAYWSVGGHEVVKDKVLEDIEFAQALRRAGYRIGLATAFDELHVRMYRSFDEIVQGLGKHATAGRQASGWRAFWAVARMSFTLLVPPLLLMASVLAMVLGFEGGWGAPALLLALAASVASFLFWANRYRKWYRLSPATALLAPTGWLLYLFIVARGTFKTLLKRGVEWKGRVYS
jgi:cellulose synthase/poly-beta-1,6-N-acetylglucosamine synthase-like glycosyltransferase